MIMRAVITHSQVVLSFIAAEEKNAIKGYRVWQLYLNLWCRRNGGGFNIPNSLNQKKLCFIYDCARLAGWKWKEMNQIKDREKALYVRHWIDAMKTDKNKH